MDYMPFYKWGLKLVLNTFSEAHVMYGIPWNWLKHSLVKTGMNCKGYT